MLPSSFGVKLELRKDEGCLFFGIFALDLLKIVTHSHDAEIQPREIVLVHKKPDIIVVEANSIHLDILSIFFNLSVQQKDNWQNQYNGQE